VLLLTGGLNFVSRLPQQLAVHLSNHPPGTRHHVKDKHSELRHLNLSREPLISCGVVVTDGRTLLLGHATRSPRWDIPKGLAQTGEKLSDAAVRELQEETGLTAPPQALSFLGVHAYLRDKRLALFLWRQIQMPDPSLLICSSLIERPGFETLPELDRFGIFAIETALSMVGKNLKRVLNEAWPKIAEAAGAA
jgi:putative (di)nucleoside polyphosphate hydrolase